MLDEIRNSFLPPYNEDTVKPYTDKIEEEIAAVQKKCDQAQKKVENAEAEIAKAQKKKPDGYEYRNRSRYELGGDMQKLMPDEKALKKYHSALKAAKTQHREAVAERHVWATDLRHLREELAGAKKFTVVADEREEFQPHHGELAAASRDFTDGLAELEALMDAPTRVESYAHSLKRAERRTRRGFGHLLALIDREGDHG